jgi:hypothetical protein
MPPIRLGYRFGRPNWLGQLWFPITFSTTSEWKSPVASVPKAEERTNLVWTQASSNSFHWYPLVEVPGTPLSGALAEHPVKL